MSTSRSICSPGRCTSCDSQLRHGRHAAQREGDVGARAGRLHQLDRRRRGAGGPGRLLPLARRHMLRAQAEDDRAAVGQAVARRAGRARLRAVADLDRPAAAGLRQLRRDEVHLRRAEEAGDEAGRRPLEQVERRALLLDPAVAQQHDAVGQRHRLDLVVGDVDHGLAQLLVQALDLAAHLVAQLGVEVAQSGSSNRNSRALRTMARPMATRWRWPPDSWRGRRSSSWVDAEHVGGALRRASRSRPAASCGRAGRRRCSRTRSGRGRARSSGTPWRCRGRAGGHQLTDLAGDLDACRRPASSSPAMVRSSVDLPQPEGPTRTRELAGRRPPGRCRARPARRRSSCADRVILRSAIALPLPLDRAHGDAAHQVALQRRHGEEDRDGAEHRHGRDLGPEVRLAAEIVRHLHRCR